MSIDRRSKLPGRQYEKTGERLASLETSLDVVRSDVAGISNSMDQVQEELKELSQGTVLQNYKLEDIEEKVEAVQKSQTNMKDEIIYSVHGLLKIAKATTELDKSLEKDLGLFNKERIAQYKKLGAFLAMIAGLVWGFLEYINFGGLNSRPVSQQKIDHLQGK